VLARVVEGMAEKWLSGGSPRNAVSRTVANDFQKSFHIVNRGTSRRNGTYQNVHATLRAQCNSLRFHSNATPHTTHILHLGALRRVLMLLLLALLLGLLLALLLRRGVGPRPVELILDAV
jgi:hypothetical protein